MVISICNEKGGSGKSTLATNLAIYHKIKTNEPLWLVDTDPQQSIRAFLSIRTNENLEKAFNFTYQKGDELKEFINKNKNEFVLIDTGGRDSREMRIAISLSDIVLIPTIASQFDISVLDLMIERLKIAKEINPKLQAYIIINRATTNPFLRKKIEQLKQYIKEAENNYIKLSERIVYERESYKIATSEGKGVSELNIRNNKAHIDIEELYKEIIK